jgi:hypothetical protein
VVLAFEVDHFDHAERGWSVVARGRSEVVVDASEQYHIRRVWPPRPWADGRGRHSCWPGPSDLARRDDLAEALRIDSAGLVGLPA